MQHFLEINETGLLNDIPIELLNKTQENLKLRNILVFATTLVIIAGISVSIYINNLKNKENEYK